MELNKKVFSVLLSQIKAFRDVAVLRNSPIDGYLDILYFPKTANLPKAIHRMTFHIGGIGLDLFDDTPPAKLEKPISVYVNRVKNILASAQSCILENGCINGISIEVDKEDLQCNSAANILEKFYDDLSNKVNSQKNFVRVNFKKADWAYAVEECSKFVSNDDTRYYLHGICFDFFRVKNVARIVATEGRRLILLKQAINSENNVEEESEFIIPSFYLFIPSSDYSSVQLRLKNNYGQFTVNTVDYSFEGLFECIDCKFPNYPNVIPEVTEKTQWFTLCASSFRMAMESIKSLFSKNECLYINAENPESLSLSVAGGSTALEIEGTASRPMRVGFFWEQLSPCLFDGSPLTKFYLNGSREGVLSYGSKTRGLALDVLKIFMPAGPAIPDDEDNFRMPKEKAISVV